MTDENMMCSSCKFWKELVGYGFFFGLGFLYDVGFARNKIVPREEEEEEGN